MATSSKLLTAGVVVAIVALAITTFRRDAENEKLRREVAALAASVQRAQHSPPAETTVRVYETRTIVEKPAGPVQGEAEGPVPTSKQASQELAARVDAALPQLLERRFSSETRDRDWAARTEKRIESAIEAISFPGAELTNVECHQSVCRAMGKFDSKEHFNRMMFALFSPSDGISPLAEHASRAPPLEERADGKFYTALYVFREGVEFNPVAELEGFR